MIVATELMQMLDLDSQTVLEYVAMFALNSFLQTSTKHCDIIGTISFKECTSHWCQEKVFSILKLLSGTHSSLVLTLWLVESHICNHRPPMELHNYHLTTHMYSTILNIQLLTIYKYSHRHFQWSSTSFLLLSSHLCLHLLLNCLHLLSCLPSFF